MHRALLGPAEPKTQAPNASADAAKAALPGRTRTEKRNSEHLHPPDGTRSTFAARLPSGPPASATSGIAIEAAAIKTKEITPDKCGALAQLSLYMSEMNLNAIQLMRIPIEIDGVRRRVRRCHFFWNGHRDRCQLHQSRGLRHVSRRS